MKKRLIIITILLIIVGSIIIISSSHKQTTKPSHTKNTLSAKISLEKFHLVETVQGHPQWEIAAQNAKIKETETELKKPNFKIFSKSSGHVLSIKANDGNINRATKCLELKGKVEAVGYDNIVFTTQNLIWQPTEAKLVTDNEVLLHKENFQFSGLGMELRPTEQRLEVKNNVKIVQTLESPIVIKADRVIWDKKQKITSLFGNVVITNNKMTFSGNQIDIIGEMDNIKQIICKGKVKAIDNEIDVCLEGEEIIYNNQNSYIVVTIQPKLSMKKQNSEIIASKMEAYLDEKRFVCSGDVHITHKDIKAVAALATYYDNEKRIILTGNPEIIQNKNRFSAEKIIYYLENEKIELLNGVTAILNTK